MSTQYPTILIHGIFDTSSKMDVMANYLKKHNIKTFAPTLSSEFATVGLDILAHKLEKYIEENIPENSPFHIVGFSMGAIVARYYMQNLAGYKRVKTFIAIGAPHHGSMLAFCVKSDTCIHLTPGGEFITQLNSNLEPLKKVNFINIWTPFDMMIVPAKNCTMEIGKEIKVKELLHGKLVENKHVLDLIVKHLE